MFLNANKMQHMNTTTRNWIIGLFTIVLVGLFVWNFFNLVLYIFIAAFLSLLGAPIVRFLDKIGIWKIRLPHAVNAILAMLIVAGMLASFIAVFIPITIHQMNIFAGIDIFQTLDNFKEPINQFEDWLIEKKLISDNEPIEVIISNYFLSFVQFSSVEQVLMKFINVTSEVIISIVVIFFATFFFLKDDRLLYNAIISITPDAFRYKMSTVLSSAKRLLTKYFWGIILDALLVATLISLGMYIMGVSNALMIGIVAGALNVIPYIGPLMSLVLGTFIGITNQLYYDPQSVDVLLLIKMLSLYVVVNFSDGFIIQPFIFSKIVKAHPLEILLVLLIAAQIAGIFGMIIAIPCYSLLRIIIKEFLSGWGVINSDS